MLGYLAFDPTQDSNYNFIIIDRYIAAYITGYLYWSGFKSTLQHDFNSRAFEI